MNETSSSSLAVEQIRLKIYQASKNRLKVKLAFKKYPPDDFPELNLHDYENHSILSASSRDLRNYIGHQISYSQPAEFSPNITQLIRDVENEDSEKMLTLIGVSKNN